MKTRLLLALMVVLCLAVIPIACSNDNQEPTDPGHTTTPTDPALPPSQQELESQGFEHPEVGRVTCEGLKKMMDDGEDIVLVDTRMEFSYKNGHLTGARQIPGIPEGNKTEEWINNQLKALPTDKTIVFYCD